MPNFRSTLLGTVLSSALCFASANAADLSYPGGLKDAGYVAIWSGPYFGVHGGGAWSGVDVTDIDGAHNKFSNDGSGGFGGGTLGWNWQWSNNIVTSFELDLGVLDVSHTSIDPASAGIKAHMDGGAYGDVTGRVGYAMNQTLLYAKGGFGFFNGAARATSPVDATFKTDSFTGWTAGGGVEYKLTPNWSVKAEYLHFDFGSQETHFINSGGRWNNDVSLDTVKLGVNYEILDVHKPLK
jgi:outer membrane immunogenic protein